MRAALHLVDAPNLEREWRLATIEVHAARRTFEGILRQHTADSDPDYDRAWLRLWRAERRWNELARLMD